MSSTKHNIQEAKQKTNHQYSTYCRPSNVCKAQQFPS